MKEKNKPSSQIDFFKTSLLLIIATLIACIIAEMFVRVKFKNEVDLQTLREELTKTKIDSFIRPSNNANLFYELLPNVRVKWNNSIVVTDPSGYFRISEVQKEPVLPDIKVALVGDSTAFGWKVNYEETYGEILRKKLEDYTHKSISLRNYSVPGYNSHQILTTLKERVLEWNPDLIILHYDHNDADPIKQKPPNYIAPTYGENFLKSALVKFVMRRYRYFINLKLTSVPSDQENNPEKILGNYRYAGPMFDKHINNLEKIIDIARKRDIPVICYVFNNFVTFAKNKEKDKTFTLLHKPLGKKLTSMGYMVIDSYEHGQRIFVENNWGDWKPTWCSARDAHPNQLGHQIIADIIFKYVSGKENLFQGE